MKFIYTEPKNGALQIDLIEGEKTRFVEDQKGNQTLKLGIGKSSEMNNRKLITAIRKSIRIAREHAVSSVTLSLSDFRFDGTRDMSDIELGRLVAENSVLANYEFTKYKSPSAYSGVETIYITQASKEFADGVKIGHVVGEETNYARTLANTPGGDMTPETLAAAAKAQVKGTTAKVTVIDLKGITKLKMGMVLGVAKGAEADPRFIIVEYWGTAKNEKPVVLVGKGVTFDSGGLDIKPADGMLGMHHDMSGGGAVIAAVAIAAKLKLKKNVVALVPAVENAVSGNAYRPGDILTALDGTTVEVLNTDAEGRLILGDALVYAERYNPRLTIDVATLTGAAEVALGNRASAIFTRNSELENDMRRLGEKSGDYVWPLPLWKEYEADIKGTHADLSNIPSQNSRKGGSITAATFLAHFARNLGRWVHIDMAPRDTAIPEDSLAKGSTGAPVRLLVRVIEECN